MTAVSRPALPDRKGMTVLVIDDDSDSLEVLSTFLRACSGRVLIARNAAAGSAYVDEAPALDAVVSDCGDSFLRKVYGYRAPRDRTARRAAG
jgi:response regulator RpfG family c-di-GMP phosphodiesterase